jgi:hypothetical protein
VLHAALAVRGGKQIRGRSAQGVIEDADNQTAVDLELAARLPRAYATLEHFWMRDEQKAPLAGRDIHSRGFHAQAGYMVVPRTIEVALRLARIDGDTRVDDSGVREWRGGVDYYWRSHSLKLQVDAGQVEYGAGFSRMSVRARSGLPALGPRLVAGRSLTDTQLRAQFQLAF